MLNDNNIFGKTTIRAVIYMSYMKIYIRKKNKDKHINGIFDKMGDNHFIMLDIPVLSLSKKSMPIILKY